MTDPTSDPPRYSLEFWRQYCRLTYETFLRSGAPEDQAFNHAVTQALKGFREEGMPSCETMEHQSMADDAIEKMERVVYELRDEYPNHFVAVDLRTDEVVLAREDGMAFYEALRAMDRDQFQTLYTFHTALFSPQG